MCRSAVRVRFAWRCGRSPLRGHLVNVPYRYPCPRPSEGVQHHATGHTSVQAWQCIQNSPMKSIATGGLSSAVWKLQPSHGGPYAIRCM